MDTDELHKMVEAMVRGPGLQLGMIWEGVLRVALTITHVLSESIEIDGVGVGSKYAGQQLNRMMVSY